MGGSLALGHGRRVFFALFLSVLPRRIRVVIRVVRHARIVAAPAASSQYVEKVRISPKSRPPSLVW